MKQKTLFLAVVGALTIAIGSAWGVEADLPYGTDFEDGTSGDNLTGVWSFTDVGRYDSSKTTVDGSTNSAYASDSLTLALIDGIPDNTNVWWTGYAIVTPGSSNPTLADTEAAAFYVNTGGDVVANSNATWIVFDTNFSTTEWQGFAVHIDFVNDTWDLYAVTNGFSFGDPMTKLNTGGALAFNANYTGGQLTNVVVEGTTYIDQFSVSYDASGTPVDDSTPDSSVNASVEIYLNGNLSGLLSQYFSVLDSTMQGPLGDALYGALADTDIVHVYTPADGTWQTFEHQGAGSGWNHTGTDNDPTIYQTTGLWIELAGNASERNPSMTVAYTALVDPIAATVYGTTGSANGWTALAWPVTDSKGFGTPADLKLPAATAGDVIWLYEMLGSGRMGYRRIRWNGTAWVDRDGSATSAILTHGKAFWYFRNTGADGTWNADQLQFIIWE